MQLNGNLDRLEGRHGIIKLNLTPSGQWLESSEHRMRISFQQFNHLPLLALNVARNGSGWRPLINV